MLAEPQIVLDYLKSKGISDEHPFVLASMMLNRCNRDWTEAHSELKQQANRFSLQGEERLADVISLAARIVFFYGRGQ